MRFSRYPRLKPSEVAWLDGLPEHWEMCRLGQIGKFSKGRGGNKGDESSSGVPCIRYGDLYTTHQYFVSKSRSFVSPTRADQYTCIKFGDVLLAGSGETLDEIGKSAVNLIESDACCGSDVIIFRPEREVENRFIGYAMDCHLTAAQKAAMGKGVTVIHIYWTSLKYVVLSLPPILEQIVIADFLDYETKKINLIVAKKRILIKRLEEKRSALITYTVTQGIPSRSAPQSDHSQPFNLANSSAKCLAKTGPRNWFVQKIKYIASINDEVLSEATDPNLDMLYVDIGCVDSIRGIIRSERMIFEQSPSRARRIVRHGDVIISTVRTYLRAISAINNPVENTVVSTGFAVVRPNGISPRFLGYALSASEFVEGITARSVGVSYPAINASEIGTLSIPVPSETEQEAIADFLDHEVSRLDASISKVKKAIERLHEYRTALVTAAVTGMIDVRGSKVPSMDWSAEEVEVSVGMDC